MKPNESASPAGDVAPDASSTANASSARNPPATLEENQKAWKKLFGVTDEAVVSVRMGQATGSAWLPNDLDAAGYEARMSDVIHTIAALTTVDECERMLTSQMVACHHAAMECYRRAMIEGQSFEGRDSNLKHAEKLGATYAKLLDTLNKHRGKGQQKVTVEHVHVAPGGQAFVGNLDTGSAPAAPIGRRRVAPPQLEHQATVPLPFPVPEALEVKPAGTKRRG